MEHILKGQYGEHLASNYLVRKDFEILHRNWRCGRNEIDIIASKKQILHFVEVKTRHSLKFGFPEQSVSRKKFIGLKNAAVNFLNKNGWNKNIQFDILSVLVLPGKEIEYLFIEDVYLY